MAYAGTACSVQARTAATTVLYIAKPTDAREVYVGLTRHRFDAYVVVERDRLEEATKRGRLSPTSIEHNKEQLFREAATYAEKFNVADFVDDKIEFIRTGNVDLPKYGGSLNLRGISRAMQRLTIAAVHWNDRPNIMPLHRLLNTLKGTQRSISRTIDDLVNTFQSRIIARRTDRTAERDRGVSR